MSKRLWTAVLKEEIKALAKVKNPTAGQCETKQRKGALLERRLAIDAIGGVETCKCALGTGVERHYSLPRTVLEYTVKEVEGQPYKLTDRHEKDDDGCDHEWGAHECGCYQVLGDAFMDVHGHPVADMIISCKDDLKVCCDYLIFINFAFVIGNQRGDC